MKTLPLHNYVADGNESHDLVQCSQLKITEAASMIKSYDVQVRPVFRIECHLQLMVCHLWQMGFKALTKAEAALSTSFYRLGGDRNLRVTQYMLQIDEYLNTFQVNGSVVEMAGKITHNA